MKHPHQFKETTMSDLSHLPFVDTSDGVPTRLWTPTPSGDWTADNATGHGYADALVDFMRENERPPLLGQVAHAMAATGQWSGVEVGFFHRLAERLV